ELSRKFLRASKVDRKRNHRLSSDYMRLRSISPNVALLIVPGCNGSHNLAMVWVASILLTARGAYAAIPAPLVVTIGHQHASELDEPGWRLLQTSVIKLESGAKPIKLSVRLYWGDQRMGVLQVDTAAPSVGSKQKAGRTLYKGLRSWQWCTFTQVQ